MIMKFALVVFEIIFTLNISCFLSGLLSLHFLVVQCALRFLHPDISMTAWGRDSQFFLLSEAVSSCESFIFEQCVRATTDWEIRKSHQQSRVLGRFRPTSVKVSGKIPVHQWPIQQMMLAHQLCADTFIM